MVPNGFLNFVLKYGGGGLVSYATPRILVASGVPLDAWITEAGKWAGIHITLAWSLYIAALICGLFLLVLSHYYSKFSGPRSARLSWQKVERLEMWQAACLWVNEEPKIPINHGTAPYPILKMLNAAIVKNQLATADSTRSGKHIVDREDLIKYAKKYHSVMPFFLQTPKPKIKWKTMLQANLQHISIAGAVGATSISLFSTIASLNSGPFDEGFSDAFKKESSVKDKVIEALFTNVGSDSLTIKNIEYKPAYVIKNPKL